MPKNKHKRIERVKYLPNVIFFDRNQSLPPLSYPWYQRAHENKKIVLELGCGKGEHTLEFAASDKDKLFVGVDNKSHRICVGAELAISKGLENVYFLRSRIEQITQFFIYQSIHEIWVTFPDPHPKRQNIKSRLTSALFLDDYAKILVPGGRVILKTDSDLLYAYSMESVKEWGGEIIEASGDIHQHSDGLQYANHVCSAFEKTALSKSSTIKFLAFKL